MADKSSIKPRRRGAPIPVVDHSEAESFPHMPWSVSLDEEQLGDSKAAYERKEFGGDLWNIILLLFLYILQGIPLGLSFSIPMLLQSRKVTYTQQAIFSFAYWPFSIKLLWAPLVDSVYISWFGRRKTWLIPSQYLLGAFMILLSFRITSIMGDDIDPDGDRNQVDVVFLTVSFFILEFLAATQDIVVDGWALTMLSRQNVGWSSTCNTVGQTAGFFLGNVIFLALESADFCNNYLRSESKDEGIVTLSSFLFFCGIVFLLTTTFLALFKQEHIDPEIDPDQGVVETYKTLLSIIHLPAIVSYIVFLLTAKVTFTAADELTSLKLVEAGVPKEQLALFAVPMVPIQIILPLMISKYTHGPRPMDVYLKAFPYRILIGPVYGWLVYWSYSVQTAPGQFPWHFYVVVLLVYAVHQVLVYMNFVSLMAFHAKISDPAIGGTYMTLLNTLANLGASWPSTLALWLVDYFTAKHCEPSGMSCSSQDLENICKSSGGTCNTTIDGYYILIAFCFIYGFLWLIWRGNKLKYLDSLPLSAWKCSQP